MVGVDRNFFTSVDADLSRKVILPAAKFHMWGIRQHFTLFSDERLSDDGVYGSPHLLLDNTCKN